MPDTLSNFRRDAKALQKAFEAGDKPSINRVQAIGVRGDLKRADFLHVIARENAFPSWPAMKEAVTRMGLDRAQRQQRLKIALWHGQAQVIRDLVWEDPEVTDGVFGLQCALYEPRVLEQLQENPGLAHEETNGRRPILHLSFSKAFLVFPERQSTMFEIAEALLAAGADVNDTFLAPEDGVSPLSALYGALGHAGNLPLAQWLLDHGADPNDGESLYHATELGNAEGLAMLLRAGAKPDGTNALLRAMDFNNEEMVRMLLEAGANPNVVSGGVAALQQAARRMSSPEICRLLIDFGAEQSAEGTEHDAYVMASVYGNAPLAKMLKPVELTADETLLSSAATGTPPSGKYIDPAKLPKAYRTILREIVHLPNKLEHMRGLVAIGMPWDEPDAEGLTPVQVAGWSGLPDVLAYYLSLKPDLGHINGYGGTLLSTIIHGSENNPDRAGRDYLGCLRLVLEEGVALPKRAIRFAGVAEVKTFLQDWAEKYPGQVVEHGVA